MKPWVLCRASGAPGGSRRVKREHQSYAFFVLLAPREPFWNPLGTLWEPSRAHGRPQKVHFRYGVDIKGSKREVLERVRKRGRKRSLKVIRNERILRAWSLENRAPVHTGCVFRENDPFEKTSRKIINMRTQKTPQMEPKGSLGRSWARLLTFRMFRKDSDFG